jgi:Domain of unknown function (DUF4184)
MPFTLAHPAAALPLHRLCRSRLPLSALIIGTMAPDFAYFTPYAAGVATHNLEALIWFCWPLGFAVWLVFTQVLERPTIALLPLRCRPILRPDPERMGLSLLTRVSIALLSGAATHLIWDSFTHATSPVVAAIPILRATVFEIAHAPVRLYKVLQHASTIVGLSALASWALRQYRMRQSEPLSVVTKALPALSVKARWFALGAIVIAACTAATIDFVLHSSSPLERRLFHFAIGGMAGLTVAWTLVAFLVLWRERPFGFTKRIAAGTPRMWHPRGPQT